MISNSIKNDYGISNQKNIILPHDAVSYLVNSVLVVLLHIEELSQFVKN